MQIDINSRKQLNKPENYAAFYRLLNRRPTSDRDALKESIVSQYTEGRTTSLREMCIRDRCGSDKNRQQTGKSQNHGTIHHQINGKKVPAPPHRPPDGRTGPVSYTHLDVYKRQVKKDATGIGSGYHIEKSTHVTIVLAGPSLQSLRCEIRGIKSLFQTCLLYTSVCRLRRFCSETSLFS